MKSATYSQYAADKASKVTFYMGYFLYEYKHIELL